LRGTLTGPSASINGVAFDASGSQLAALASDGPIYIWDTATRNLVKTFAADNGQQATAFRTDGQLFAATGGSAQSWNLKDGTSHPIGTADEGAARVTAMDPSGRQIAWSAEDGTVRVRDATTGAETARFAAGSATIVSLTFGRDRLAVGTLDGTCVVWELSTGRQCLMLRGHTNAVTALAFSPDGKRLATGGVDRVIKIWETATGQEMLSLHGIRTEVLALTFTANGQRLVMAGADGTVAVWDGSPLPR
jgi:WD40 repeat protein